MPAQDHGKGQSKYLGLMPLLQAESGKKKITSANQKDTQKKVPGVIVSEKEQ